MKLHKGLMSISDFAAYCGTTRQTMQYYDRIGLLHPLQMGSQGYRYYHPLQGHEVRLIRSLQRSGCSLEEVKDILDSTDIDVLQSRIEEKQRALELELERVRREQVYLNRFYRFLNWSVRIPLDTPILARSRNPMHMEDTVQVEECEPYSASYYDMVMEYAEYCREHHTVQVYPYVLYVDREELTKGLRFSRVLAFPEDLSLPTAQSLAVAPGQYLCMRTYPDQQKDTRPEVYDTLRRYMAENGLRAAGGSFEIPFCIPQGLRRDVHRFAVVFILPVVQAEDGAGGEEA